MFLPGKAPSRPVTADRLAELLRRFDAVMDLNMPGLELEGLEISDRSFYGCNFTHSTFRNCTIRNCTLELCFFDFSTHVGGSYEGLQAKNCVFACSSFSETAFVGSGLIQCNFNAIEGRRLLIDDCDLLHSRFDALAIDELAVNNCNLKETRFLRTLPDRLDFSYTNEEDAVFIDEESW